MGPGLMGRPNRAGGERVLVAHQPAYLPWPGYFSRLLDVGELVLLDHVQYSKQSWQPRNYILAPGGGRHLLTVPVERRSHHGSICDVRIIGDRWRRRHWLTLTQVYRDAPYWPQWRERLQVIYDQPWRRLAPLNTALTQLLIDGFCLETTLVNSTAVAPAGHKTAMLIDLCRRRQAGVLRVGSGALDYLDAAQLRAADIGVQIATYSWPAYPQRPGKAFQPGLSALDLLLHCGPGARRFLAAGARLSTWESARQEVIR